MILVEVKREYKSIYNLKAVCGLAVTVEPLKTKTTTIECHKCQLFGHSQKTCHIDYKCMKCGENHSTHLCVKPATTPPNAPKVQHSYKTNACAAPRGKPWSEIRNSDNRPASETSNPEQKKTTHTRKARTAKTS
ncbi:hypothetical protein Trydic_g4855 [Trypoxylus dichotomus]